MDIENIRQYALAKPNTTEGLPFGEGTLVFKVNNKMFLLIALDVHPMQINVKCHPEKAVELREQYADVVLPGYHMNKKHWNTVVLNGMLSAKIIYGFIDDSYQLVMGKK